MAPTLWLLFLLVVLPVVLYLGRFRRISLAGVVVLLSALFGLWRPLHQGPTLSPWVLEFLVTLLLFRLGGRVRLEDLRRWFTLTWSLVFLGASLVTAFVFRWFPFFERYPVSLALILQAGAPIVLLAFLREDRPHGVMIRVAQVGTYVHLSLMFLLLFAFQQPGVAGALERLVVYLLVSGFVGVVLGLLFAYLEAKVDEAFYLVLLTVGILAFLQGLYGLLHLSTGFTILLAGAVASNTSLRNQHLWHTLDPYEYPAILVFLGLVFFEVRWVSWEALAWGLLGTGVVAGGIRAGITFLGFLGRDREVAWTLALFTLVQGALPLWWVHRSLPGFHALDLPLTLLTLAGVFLWRQAFESELSLVIHTPLETFWAPETTTLVHKLLRVFRKPPTLQNLRAADLLRTTFLTVPSEATLEQVVQALLKAQAHAVPVVDEQRRVLGVVRGADLEHLFTDEQTRHLIRAIDVMIPYGGLSPDTPAPRILEQMNQLATDCLPVASEGKILGVVLKRDLLTRHV